MKFLRLVGDSACNSEYYVDDLTSDFLGGISNLNVVVGANNTRKSRFMRQVINMPHKLIVESDIDVNKFVRCREELFQSLDDDFMQEKLITFIFSDLSPPKKIDVFNIIKTYFDRSISQSNTITFFDIRKEVYSLHQELVNIAVPDKMQEFYSRLKTIYEVVNLVQQVYKKLSEQGRLYYNNIKHHSSIAGISYTIPYLIDISKLDDYHARYRVLSEVMSYLENMKMLKLEVFMGDMIYIPSLRGARKLSGAASNTYKKTVIDQFNLKENTKLSIETGLDFYDKIELARNGRRNQRLDFAEFEKFISKVFFYGKAIDIIAVKGAASEQHVEISFEDGKIDVPIHHLGDGIQAIMNLVLPIFTAKEGSWIFIDEPELHLHPGFQNIFMNAILQQEVIKNKKLRFFINTHSNHILTESLLSASNSEIFVFSGRDKDASNVAFFNGNEYQTMQLLGVMNTSVLVSNCSLWVEGVTDRLYLKAFLYAYQSYKGFKGNLMVEGLNYSFIEYAGGNLIHYCFDPEENENEDQIENRINTFFINSNVFLVADADFGKGSKHQYYESIRKDNFEYFQTERPEIENILPKAVLKMWLKDDVKCDEAEIEKCFERSYDKVKLGKYFEDQFTLGKGFRKLQKKGGGGTLTGHYKDRLAKFVYTKIMEGEISWNELKESDVLKSLVLKAHIFISKKNTLYNGVE